MNIVKSLTFKGIDVRFPFASIKFEPINHSAWKSGKANNKKRYR